MKKTEEFYDESVTREWERMERHPLEFALTKRALAKYLSGKCKILDVGGGPGRYALHLAAQGHEVTLLDLSRQNLLYAEAKAVEMGLTLKGFVHGNALDLGSFADAAFDAVLLMGPLYHLLDANQREQAAKEAIRVLRPGGHLFAAHINRFALIFHMLINAPENIGSAMAEIDGILATGVHRPEAGFTDAYFANPDEVVPDMEKLGLKVRRYMSAEGFSTQCEEKLKMLDASTFEMWVDLNWRLSAEPSLVGSAMHFLYVGEKEYG